MDVSINRLCRNAHQLLQLTASLPQEDVFILHLQKFLKKKVRITCYIIFGNNIYFILYY